MKKFSPLSALWRAVDSVLSVSLPKKDSSRMRGPCLYEALENRRMMDGLLDDANSTFPDGSMPEGSSFDFTLHFVNNAYEVGATITWPGDHATDFTFDEMYVRANGTAVDDGAIYADAATNWASYGWPYEGHWDLAEVYNVAPTATLNAGTSATQGDTFSLSLTDPYDPSWTDTYEGFTYSFALDPEELSSGGSSSASGGLVLTTPGVVTVYGRIADKDGGYTDYEQTVTVAVSTPTVTINGAPSSSAEGTTLSLTSSVSDPAHSTFTYAWAVEKNGSPYATSTNANWNFKPTDNGTYVFSLGATNGDSGTGYATSQTVTVTNVAPTVSIVARSVYTYTTPPDTITNTIMTSITSAQSEGVRINALGNVSDPGSADTFTYAWTVTRNGSAYTTGTSSAIDFTPNDNGVYVFNLTVTDDDGGSNNATAKTVTVNNVAPTAIFQKSKGATTTGASFTLSMTSPLDPASADSTYTYAFDTNDGDFADTGESAGSSTTKITSIGSEGLQYVYARIYDKDGGYNQYRLSVYVNDLSNDGSGLEVGADGVVITGAEVADAYVWNGSAYIYNPERWNRANVVETVNCYSYALNYTGAWGLVGSYGSYGYPVLDQGDTTGAGVIGGIAADSAANQSYGESDPIIYLGTSASDTVTWATNAADYSEYYVIAAFIDPWDLGESGPAEAVSDYHFYRHGGDGYWTHKPGSLPATDRDDSNALVSDPTSADRSYMSYDYSNFVGYFAVRNVASEPIIVWG